MFLHFRFSSVEIYFCRGKQYNPSTDGWYSEHFSFRVGRRIYSPKHGWVRLKDIGTKATAA